MSWLNPVLERMRDPFGRRRFFPPGAHPVTARLRAYIKTLEAFPPSDARDQSLEHVQAQHAMFEEGESLAKQIALRRSGRAS